jgi:DNA-binding response OmpR family regulator
MSAAAARCQICREREVLVGSSSQRSMGHSGFDPGTHSAVPSSRYSSAYPVAEAMSAVSARATGIAMMAPMAIIVGNAHSDAECQAFLNQGADDAYVINSPMCEVRLHALTRRARALNADMRIALGDLVVDREHRRLWCAGAEVYLSGREFDVFICLFHSAASAVEKEALSLAVWREDGADKANAVEVYIGYLRKKLAESRVVTIETMRRVGYALVARAR